MHLGIRVNIYLQYMGNAAHLQYIPSRGSSSSRIWLGTYLS